MLINQTTNPSYELRAIQSLQLRANGDENRTIHGHAALFNTLSDGIYGMFFEQITIGAFTNALKKSDPRCLLNHDPNFVLGRVSAKTLRLNEDENGLAFENDVPDTQIGRDLMTSIKRGDISQMSFAFTVLRDDWQYVGPKLIRTIVEVDELFDVSPVTYPAYPATVVSVNARSKAIAMREQRSNVAPAGAGAVVVPSNQQVLIALRRRELELMLI